jgi:hypothetical protein
MKYFQLFDATYSIVVNLLSNQFVFFIYEVIDLIKEAKYINQIKPLKELKK